MRNWRTMAKEALDLASIGARFLCLMHVTNTYLCSSNHVYGPSMLPTLNSVGDVVVAEHVSHRLGNVDRGDVVFVQSQMDPNKVVTKRIVGLEGDKVTFQEGGVFGRTISLVVPKGHVWIQGDNLYFSTDSRHFGPVPYGLIRGKVLLRVWPPHCSGFLEQ